MMVICDDEDLVRDGSSAELEGVFSFVLLHTAAQQRKALKVMPIFHALMVLIIKSEWDDVSDGVVMVMLKVMIMVMVAVAVVVMVMVGDGIGRIKVFNGDNNVVIVMVMMVVLPFGLCTCRNNHSPQDTTVFSIASNQVSL